MHDPFVTKLDIKSKKSTAKIQEIQPQINLINEKYANDPEKKSKKMQEVYAANHINPLGGCLPMLLISARMVSRFSWAVFSPAMISQTGIR